MGQCYSGGFIDNFTDEKTVIITSTNCDQSSMHGDDISPDGNDPYENERYVVNNPQKISHHSEFFYHIINALRQKTVFYKGIIPSDVDGNGYISIFEAFNWHLQRNSRTSSETPQYSDIGNIGSSTFLNVDIDRAYAGISFNPNATAINSQRSLIGEYGSGFHNIFMTKDSIFYRKTNQNGTSWIFGKFLNEGMLNNEYPSISSSGSVIITVWQSKYGSDYYLLFSRSTNNGLTWQTDQLCDLLDLEIDPIPVIASTINGNFLVVFKGNTGLKYIYTNDFGNTWSSIGDIPYSNSSSYRPSLSVDSNNDFPLTYDDGYNVYFQKFSTNSFEWYGGEEEICDHSCGIHEHKNSQVTSYDGQNFIHSVWQGLDTYTQGVEEVIVHRKYKSSLGWSLQTVFRQYGSRYLPSATAHKNFSEV